MATDSRARRVGGVDQQTFNYDDNDRLQTDTWDDNGNTLASGTSSYSYNSDDRLTGFSNGDGTATFVYDGDGNRVAKTAPGQTTRFLVDTENPTGYAQVLEERDGNGALTNVYSYGHDLLAQHPTGTQPSFYGYDALGSTRLLSSSGGAISDAYTYDAFGVQLAHIGTTPNLYRYTGEQMDDTIGLQYLRARKLNAGAGRFLARDEYEGNPAIPTSENPFAYTEANPANGIDPTGYVRLDETVESHNIGHDVSYRHWRMVRVRKHLEELKKNICGVAEYTAAVTVGPDHHVIPKHMGGPDIVIKLPQAVHSKFHSILHHLQKLAGLPGSKGKYGSGRAWENFLKANPGKIDEAFMVLVTASIAVDEICGTEITSTLLQAMQ